MKLLFDFLPILLFFGTFKFAESQKDWAVEFASRHLGMLVSGGSVNATQAPVMLATVVVIAATLAQVIVLKALRKRVDNMLWVSLALVVVLGGATIYFQSEAFIKWKPTALYWAMGLALWLTPLFTGKNALRALLGAQISLPDRIWQRLTLAWVIFFAAMGVLNLWVAYTFSLDTWVNFKLFGGVGLMLLFTLAQGLVLSRYIEDEPTAAAKPADRA